MNDYHKPVLLQQVLDFLHVQPNGKFIDATLGGGGHTNGILDQGGKVLGVDQDSEALDFVKQNQESRIKNQELILVYGNFKDLEKIARLHNFTDVSGILFDLGVSSYQLDTKERGFSFQANAKLDMRMDKALGVTASDLLNALTKNELTLLFTKYGEEPQAKRFAQRIVEARKTKPIETTKELSDILAAGYHPRHQNIHPATRVFQALRIAVNDELYSLEEALPEAISVLKPGGRLAVISFHSLEDRIVKQAFVSFAEKKLGYIVTKKPILATEEEVEQNPRSRSAKLRVFEKI